MGIHHTLHKLREGRTNCFPLTPSRRNVRHLSSHWKCPELKKCVLVTWEWRNALLTRILVEVEFIQYRKWLKEYLRCSIRPWSLSSIGSGWLPSGTYFCQTIRFTDPVVVVHSHGGSFLQKVETEEPVLFLRRLIDDQNLLEPRGA